MSGSISKVLTRSTIYCVLLGLLTFTCLAAVEREMTQMDGCSSSTRELWRVLFGVGATLGALLVSAAPWECCLVPLNGEQHHNRNTFRFVVMLYKILSPQVCVPWVLTAGYATILMRHRKSIMPSISKRLCPMVVWIGIDAGTYGLFFGQQDSLSSVESNMAAVQDNEGQGSTSVESMARNNDTGPVERTQLVITENEKTTVQEYFKYGPQLRKAPNLKVAVPWPGSLLPTAEGDQPYYFCLQGWDRKTVMWKEAMVVKGALGTQQNISKRMGMVKVMPWWARALLVVLGLGYEASILSRFVHHLRVSPLEVMCSWIWLLVVAEAGIVQLLVIPSYQGIHLHLNCGQFHKVVQEYIKLTEEITPPVLTCINLWSFVLCILSTFFLFLILNVPLIYYYHKLPSSSLSFVSLILFTILTGAGIVLFAVMLFSPPHHVAFAFTHLCRFPSSPCTVVLTLGHFLTGLTAYILAVTDTAMNWHLFEIQDHSFFSFMIPHIGS